MTKVDRIFIIGHIGAGKALVGKTLAEKLGWQFVDADLSLEARTGRYLSQIVGKPEGVEAFLNCQSEMLVHQLQNNKIVVATDASLLASQNNKKLIENEFVVYLKVSVPVQQKRLWRDSVRLLPMDNDADFLEALHRERDDVYEKAATLMIDTDDSAMDEHVSMIMRAISEGECNNSSDKEIKLERKDLVLFHKLKYTPVELTEQQAKCLKLLAQGRSSKEIAKVLDISHRTVEDYLAIIMEQLGCASSKELIALYHEQQ